MSRKIRLLYPFCSPLSIYKSIVPLFLMRFISETDQLQAKSIASYFTSRLFQDLECTTTTTSTCEALIHGTERFLGLTAVSFPFKPQLLRWTTRGTHVYVSPTPLTVKIVSILRRSTQEMHII